MLFHQLRIDATRYRMMPQIILRMHLLRCQLLGWANRPAHLPFRHSFDTAPDLWKTFEVGSNFLAVTLTLVCNLRRITNNNFMTLSISICRRDVKEQLTTFEDAWYWKMFIGMSKSGLCL